MAFFYPGCISRYTTFITRSSEKSLVSYATFIARQPLDDLLWFCTAYACGLLGEDGISQWSSGQFGFRLAFLVLLFVELALVFALRVAVPSRSGNVIKKRKLSVALAMLCTVSSCIFLALFSYHAYRLHCLQPQANDLMKDLANSCDFRFDFAERHEQWRMIIVLILFKALRTCFFVIFVLWTLCRLGQLDRVKNHVDLGRHNTMSCLESRGLYPKLRSFAFIGLWLCVYILYVGVDKLKSEILMDFTMFGLVAVIALIYYAIRLHTLVGPCVWSMCQHTWGWGPWCVFECKKGFVLVSDQCCQGETVELQIRRRDDTSSDVTIPDSFVTKSGSWLNTSWGLSLRQSLEHAIKKDLQEGTYASGIANDDPQAPLYFLTGQPAGFDLAGENELWTSHASNTFWSTWLAFVDEVQCCSQKIEVTTQANTDDNVIGQIFLLKVTDPSFYSSDNGGGIYHYDGVDIPLCTWCVCCQLNRGKLFARHNYCITEYCGDDAPTGMADAFIFRFGAKEKAGLEVAHVYRILAPSARSSNSNALLSQPAQATMDNV